MSKKLAVNVLVQAPPGTGTAFAVFGPDDKAVPDWALEQMGDHCFVEGNGQEGESSGYAAMDYADLQAEVAKRNEGRDDDAQIKPASRKGDDLAAALEADDKARANA